MVKTFIDGKQLPVNPLEDVTLNYKSGNKTVELVELGEATLLGDRALTGVTIKSIFPAHSYPWVSGSPRTPDYYVDYLTKRLTRKKTVRLVIAGDGVDINLRCSIESFTPQRPFGEIEVVYYTLSLKEYRSFGAARIQLAATTAATAAPARTGEKPVGKTYTVKAGDCLWSIAQSQLGNGSRYPELYSANQELIDAKNKGTGYPKYTIYSGQVLAIP